MIQKILAELNQLTAVLGGLCSKYSELSLVSVAQAESTDLERIKREAECVGCVKVVVPSYSNGISARAYLDHEILPRLRDLGYEAELSGYGSDFYVLANDLKFYVRFNSRGSSLNVSRANSVSEKPALSGSGGQSEDGEDVFAS
jgi:hypothetical protein